MMSPRLSRGSAVALLPAALASAPLAHPAEATSRAVQLPAAPGQLAGEIAIRGRTLAYRGEMGETVLRNAAGAPRATMSSVAYLVVDADAKDRPVTFFYNGGPGAATIALREGLAPMVIAPGAQRGTFVFTPNTESLLDVTDMVFVDAPQTGYGRFYGPGAKAEYLGVEEDAKAFAEFIDQWLTSHKRNASPLFLMGESYGGTRSGFLTEALAARGRPVQGLALVSPTTSAGGPNPLGERNPAVAALPTQAAVAWSHKRGAYTALSLEALAKRAETFAAADYAAALAKGNKLPARQAARIAKQVAAFTGLSEKTILDNKLKVRDFGDALIPGERLGRDDGRLLAPLSEMRKLPKYYDEPGSSLYTLSYSAPAAYDAFFRFQYGYKPAGPYVGLAEPNTWNDTVKRGPTSIPLMLKAQLASNPKLRIEMLGGYFDTTVPYMDAVGDFVAADLPKDRFSYTIYPSGHAVFSDVVARVRAADRLRVFYRSR